MDVSERIKIIREDLKMSRAAFGETLGVSGDVINNLERGRVNISESILKLISKTYRVNYFWLTQGMGEPFINVPEVIIEDAIEKYKLDETDKALIEEYVKLDPATREMFKSYLRTVFKKTPG